MNMLKYLSIGLLLSAIYQPLCAWPALYSEGVTVSDPAAYFPGYTLFAPNDLANYYLHPEKQKDTKGFVYLIDMKGNVVHRWQTQGVAFSARLLSNGNLVVMSICQPYHSPMDVSLTKTGCLSELTWDGEVVFHHQDSNMSHDFQKTALGNYLYISLEVVPDEVAKQVRGGLKGTELEGKMFGGVLKEVNPRGELVWQWHHAQHIDYGQDIIYPFFDRFELSHLNSIQLLANEQLLVSSRRTSQVFLIDKKTGNILKRYGSPMSYDPKTNEIVYRNAPHLLGGQHSCNLIDEGLSVLLCYDNGIGQGQTRVVEIDMKTNTVNWLYPKGKMRSDFSYFMGSAQRLANGNTLIAFSQAGLIDEVDPAGKLVWQYVIPKALSQEGTYLFNAFRYPSDYCSQFKTLAR